MSTILKDSEPGMAANAFERTAGSQKTSSGRNALLSAYGAALLLVGGLALALCLFLNGRGDKLDAEMLSYLPGDSNVIVGADLDALSKNSGLKELFRSYNKKHDPIEELNEKLKLTGLTTDDFSRVLMGYDVREDQHAIIWRTKKPFDKTEMAKVFGRENVTQRQKGETTYFTDHYEDVVYFPTDTLIVQTTSKHFEMLVGKKSANILVPEEMQVFVRKMSKGQAWLVASRAAFTDKDMSILNVIKGLPYIPEALVNAAKNAKMVGLSAHLDGEKLTASGTLVCGEKEQAANAEKALKTEIEDNRTKDLDGERLIGAFLKALPPQVKNSVDDFKKTLNVERSGSQLTLSGNCRIDDLFALLRAIEDYQEKLHEQERLDRFSK